MIAQKEDPLTLDSFVSCKYFSYTELLLPFHDAMVKDRAITATKSVIINRFSESLTMWELPQTGGADEVPPTKIVHLLVVLFGNVKISVE